jgi:Domain of unknown function (DUF4185)
MSAIRRIVSVSVASGAVVGLVVSIGLAPPVFATPCTAPEANVPAPAALPEVPAPAPVFTPPTGRRPRGANEHAPLPKLGPLISSFLKPLTRNPAQLQGAVTPGPTPPGMANPQVNPEAAPVRPPAPAAIAGAPTSLVDFVTGPHSPNKTLERFGISGTDLGIPWDNGDPGGRQVLMAFGDTFGYCSVHGQQWRYNVLFRSQDRDLSHGLHVADGVPNNQYSGSPVWVPGLSKQVLNSIHKAAHETGIIPTSAVSLGRAQYMNFMSIKNWGHDGEWSTNYSGIARSVDNGQSWGIFPGSIRLASADTVPGGRYFPGNENFQMGAFMKGRDGYLYSFGTPSGRGGPAFLSRVPPNFVPDLAKYQYWNGEGKGWVPMDPSAATPIFPGPVGEMSAHYNDYLKQYLVLYTNGGSNDVVARTAPSPQGPWSPEQPLVSSFSMPGGIYAPMIHPWSAGRDLYFNLSLWSAYDVMLMHTVLP